MKIGIDISPLKSGNFLQHRVRGTGFYLEHLKSALLKYYPENEYTFFARTENVPTDLDLVHIPYFEPFFITLPKKKNKMVVTVHDLTPLVFSDKFPSGFKGKIKWLVQKSRLEKAEHVITDSESSKRDIVRFTNVSQDKVSVVYLAAGEEFKQIKKGKWEEKIRKKYNLPERFGLYVGDVTWNKNLPKVIKAFIMLRKPLVLIGKAIAEEEFDSSNPWNKDLLMIRELKKNENIKTLGFVQTDDLVKIYNLATFFIMPSFYEGFGLPILEAMSCGCPVITSKEGSLEEVAGEAALFVDPYSQEEIENAIETLFKNTNKRDDLIKKGFKQTEKFSWEKTAIGTAKVYLKNAK